MFSWAKHEFLRTHNAKNVYPSHAATTSAMVSSLLIGHVTLNLTQAPSSSKNVHNLSWPISHRFQRWSCQGKFALETGSVSEQPLLADTVCKAFRPVGVLKPMWMVFCCIWWFKMAWKLCCFYQRRMVANGIRVFNDKPWNFGCLRIMAIVAAMFIFRVLAHWKCRSECMFLAMNESSGLNVADEHEYMQLGWLVSISIRFDSQVSNFQSGLNTTLHRIMDFTWVLPTKSPRW